MGHLDYFQSRGRWGVDGLGSAPNVTLCFMSFRVSQMVAVHTNWAFLLLPRAITGVRYTITNCSAPALFTHNVVKQDLNLDISVRVTIENTARVSEYIEPFSPDF